MELASAALVSPVCVVSPGELLSSNVAEEDIASNTADNLRVAWYPEVAWGRQSLGATKDCSPAPRCSPGDCNLVLGVL